MLLSGVFFFLVLAGMQMLRPVREALGVERGMDQLRWLFVATAAVSLVVAVAFGGLVSRLDRRRFIPIGLRAVVACLLAFAAARALLGDDVKQHAGTVFYVWLSVVNLFVTGFFWAYMADLWRLDQAKRLYPVIGVGGTLGALAGVSLPWQLGEALGEHGPVWLMLIAAGLLELAVWTMLALDRTELASRSPAGGLRVHRAPAPVGGDTWDGVAAVAKSPYLLGTAAYVALAAVASTLVYFTGVRLVVDRSQEVAERLPLFAELDMAKQAATLLLQLLVTARLMRWIGVGGTLCVLPLLTVLGFASVAMAGAWWSEAAVWGIFAVFQGLHSATRYGVMRPARETLFSVVSTSEKYKAKAVVDTFVYRAGDVAGALAEGGLARAVGLSVASILIMAAPLSLVWVVLALWLGLVQRRRALGGTPMHGFGHPAARASVTAAPDTNNKTSTRLEGAGAER